MPERKRFFSLRPSLILPVGPKNLQITYSGQLTCMRKWYNASTSAVNERSMFQWPRLKSIISFTIAIVILWKTGVIRISSLIASTSISFVALLVWRVNCSFEKPPWKDLKWMTPWPGLLYIEERHLHQKMHTWSTSNQLAPPTITTEIMPYT